ncbi:3084_t:CDS:2 [Funneliformis caledonium]|uniref:3084_t:CDS:1 n=1 Tax=Funneliformis caledonium TaxID=1117310 RepID=A0A9N8W2Y1_9GLOM|nr:3084_t:CDS:2 [Funneliformis caledonium]
MTQRWWYSVRTLTLMTPNPILIYPTPEEREKLRKWMGTVRWTYNKVLEMVQENGITDMNVIRELYLNNKCFIEEFSWVKETTFVRDLTIDERLQNIIEITSYSIVNGGSGFGLNLELELLWDTI